MIKCNNRIVTIDFDTYIVLSKVITVNMDYEPSMFSDGSWQLKINGIAIYSHYDSKKNKIDDRIHQGKIGQIKSIKNLKWLN